MKKFVTILVGVEAVTGLSVEGRDISNDRLLSVIEGEPLDLRCYADNGFPLPSFFWIPPVRHSLSAGLQIFQPTVIESANSQISSSSQVARYTPVLSDNNRSLSCTVRQQRGKTVQFSRTFVLRLEVVAAAKGQPLVKKVSLLSLLLLSILL